ncbi:penicillin-binding transpeptidase domain-containing protein [Nocardioides sp.]|uniref:penicillin-binding transpeptidase domain-containing protein n=1 Tax=Nocardioides sp. TaxID=35761 RepID=UPI002732B980|nr:penicillin-binding transpeptidase domain-containing protein [Nocardioides sp.]MDP3892531.1 penicillin-binding transpeptidase domain-containing protein [Nocardioides sp.]
MTSGTARPRRRRAGALATTLVLGATAACSSVPGLGPDPLEGAEDFATSLASALEAKDLGPLPVASDTEPDDGGPAALTAIVEGMGEREPTVTLDRVEEAAADPEEGTTDDADPTTTAIAHLDWSWQVGAGTWSYTTEATLHGEDGDWALAWEPSVVEPSLTGKEVLDVDIIRPRRGDILGAGDQPLVTLRDVVRFGVDKTKVNQRQAVAAAREVAAILDIDRATYVDRVRKAGEKAFVEAVVLRDGEARPVLRNGRYDAIEGAVALGTQLPLAPSRTFAAPILGTYGPATAELIEKSEGALQAGDSVGLSGLQARYEEQLAGTPGTEVDAVAPDGAERELFRDSVQEGTPLRTTLDFDAQTLAESALEDVGPASALVAIKPSTGAVLAAASGPGSEGYNTATFGQYAPGSTFKVATVLALLRAGLSPQSQVRCPPTVTVDGKQFKNYDHYPSSGLGEIPLRAAFANSCNTALIGARDEIEPADLAAAAAALGLGVDHETGFPAYFGQVPEPESDTEAAADLIGQGKVLASPMAMAAVAASVVEGEAVLPRLIRDLEVEHTTPDQPLKPKEAQALRTLMRAVVEQGSGRFLADVPGPPVLAKTGTAEYGDGDDTHAWMIAAQGDLAVAVFVETGESGSRTAGPILEAFLRGMR